VSKRNRHRPRPAANNASVRRSTPAEIASTEVDKAVPPTLAVRTGRSNTPTMVPLTDVINALTNSAVGAGSAVPLPVDPTQRDPFGPGNPLPVAPIDRPRPDTGRPTPRVSEYQVNSNVQLVSDRPLDWKLLKKAAREVGLIAECIHKRKGHLKSLRWGWVVSDDTVEEQLQAQAVPKTQQRAAKEDIEAQLRQRLQPEIARLNAWWRKPWAGNQLSLKQWVSLLIEEWLTLDAVVIYPEMTYGGDILGFWIIDGSTIKPLRDVKGKIPDPPYPAFQQLLYGFPRGEFTATTVQTEDGATVIPGAYKADQLYYFRETVRTDTPYGQSAVERALIAARIWLNRQGWLISEYDDGTGPLTWLVPPENASEALGEAFTPQKRREWQRAYNDENAGNTRQRHGTQITPPGFKPVPMPQADQMYKPDYDMFLIRILASHLGVTMPELNFTEPGGLGSTGYHEGQEDVQERVGTQPAIDFVQTIITDLGRTYQGAPMELEFRIFGLDSDDEAAADEVIDTKYKGGRMTLNETRDAQGRPRYNFAEADMPMLITPRGVVFLEGASETAPPGELVGPAQAPPNAEVPPEDELEPGSGDEPPAKPAPKPTPGGQRAAKSVELDAYRNWKRRAKSGKTFELRALTPAEAIANGMDMDRVTFKAAGDGDPKDQAPDEGAESVKQWPGWELDLDAAAYWAPRIADALSGAIDPEQLADDWIAHHPTTGAAPDDLGAAAGTWVQRERDALVAALTDVLQGVYTDGYVIGATSARAVVDVLEAGRPLAEAVADVGEWSPGATEAAQLLLGALHDGSGLRTLLNNSAVTIKSVADTKLNELGKLLADGAARGDSADTIASSIRDLLSNQSRALMIATTELNRAVSTASVQSYTLAGRTEIEWATALDDRVCPICDRNEEHGPVRIGDPFPSGDLHPPGHPWCRCAALPVIEPSDEPSKGDAR
jgi:SPP1 gp7 family putative phage head morphogenesis protein